MASRYSLTSSPQVVQKTFALESIDPFPPRRAIAPTEPVTIVRRALGGGREACLVRWGLIAGWMKDPAAMSTLFSARAETANEKPSFRGGLRHRRCLVPADGYYVWSGEKGARVAYHCTRVAGGVMAMGGIWEHWIGADGSELETMAILTVAASADVAPFTDRMPLILESADWATWLDCSSGQASGVMRLMVPAGQGLLQAAKVEGPLPRASLKDAGAI
ncbi:MAG: SOS response-associated peptidase [Hyphomicrobiaceae bacterium]